MDPATREAHAIYIYIYTQAASESVGSHRPGPIALLKRWQSNQSLLHPLALLTAMRRSTSYGSDASYPCGNFTLEYSSKFCRRGVTQESVCTQNEPALTSTLQTAPTNRVKHNDSDALPHQHSSGSVTDVPLRFHSIFAANSSEFLEIATCLKQSICCACRPMWWL